MKKGYIYITLLGCAIAGLIYTIINDYGIVEHSEKEIKLVKTLNNDENQTLTTIPKIGSVVKLEGITSFEQLLERMPQYDKEKYLKLNEQLFGALRFTDSKSYAIYLDQAFPSIYDIDYVEQNTREDIGLMLFDNSPSNSTFKEDLSLNLHAVAAVNLIRAIDELEIQTRYYFPEYKQGTRYPSMNEWPDSEYPAQVDEALKRLILSYAAVSELTAIQYLAKARYEQLSFGKSKNQNNAVVVLTKLAMADKKLGGNSNISNYVKQHYPEHIETYANLRNDL